MYPGTAVTLRVTTRCARPETLRETCGFGRSTGKNMRADLGVSARALR